MLAWRLTPLAALTNPHTIREWFTDIAAAPAAPAIVLAVFVVGGLLVFPVTLLIAATAATFGPWLGFAYAAAGAPRARSDLWRRRADRTARRSRTCSARGSTASAAPSRGTACSPSRPCAWCRSRRSRWSISPPAPAGFRFTDYLLGTILGMLPGLVLMSALGHQIFNILTAPTPLNVRAVRAGGDRLDRRFARDPGAGDLEPAETQGVTAQTGGTLRVMTWNIHGGIGPDRRFDSSASPRRSRGTIPTWWRCRRSIPAAGPPTHVRRSSCCARRSASTASRRSRSAPPTATTARCWSAAVRSTRPRSTTSPMPSASRAARSKPRSHCGHGKIRVVATHFGLSLAERRTQARRLVAIARRHRDDRP